jgi:hypothetical protein
LIVALRAQRNEEPVTQTASRSRGRRVSRIG